MFLPALNCFFFSVEVKSTKHKITHLGGHVSGIQDTHGVVRRHLSRVPRHFHPPQGDPVPMSGHFPSPAPGEHGFLSTEIS